MSNFVSVESWLDEVRRKNFFWYWGFSSFVWMCFHFTLVFFFLLQLKSPLLVWVFLWFWNFVSFLVDSPVGVLQKYFNAKKLFTASAIMMLIVSVIFLYFIYSAWSVSLLKLEDLTAFSKEAASKFFWNFLNILLLVISVVFYWVIKEFSDVTSLSYIMNNADPSEYADLLSRNNIFSWLWCLCWLLASWVILAFNPFLAVSILVWIVTVFILFILKYFDNSKDQFKVNVDFNQIKNFKVVSAKDTVESVKSYAVATVQKTDFIAAAKWWAKFIFLKPMEIKKSVDWNEIYTITKDDIKSFFSIMFQPPYSYRLIFLWSVLTFFWFWDTFVTSFLIDFINQVIDNSKWDLSKFYLEKVMTSYVFIAFLAVPAYWAQIPLIWLSKKIWVYNVIMAWVLISWISLFLFGFFSTLAMIFVLWIFNSLWYAAAMPLSQWDYSDEYNMVYASKKNLTEIDSNASSAPLKMLLNLANVIWLVLGWLLVVVIWYPWTFIVCGLLLLTIYWIWIVKKKEWKL